MFTSSGDFWLGRLTYALDKAAAAPSERSRDAYLELAHHYRSLHQLSDTGRSKAPVVRQEEPAPCVATTAGRHDFRSVHDALMQAA
jgi:hypothetical protein